MNTYDTDAILKHLSATSDTILLDSKTCTILIFARISIKVFTPQTGVTIIHPSKENDWKLKAIAFGKLEEFETYDKVRRKAVIEAKADELVQLRLHNEALARMEEY